MASKEQTGLEQPTAVVLFGFEEHVLLINKDCLSVHLTFT